MEGLDEYQLAQPDRRTYLLQVASDGDDRGVLPRAEEALRHLYGPAARVEVSRATALGPEPSGKFRLVRPSFAVDSMARVEPGSRPPLPPEVAPLG